MPELVKGIDLKFYNGKSIGLRPPEFKSQWLRLFFFWKDNPFLKKPLQDFCTMGRVPFPWSCCSKQQHSLVITSSTSSFDAGLTVPFEGQEKTKTCRQLRFEL